MKKALAILAVYYRRIAESSLGKFVASIAKGEQRTSYIEHRTSKEDGSTPSDPSASSNTSAQEDTLLAPRLNGERNATEHPTTNIQHPTSNQDSAAGSMQSAPTLHTPSLVFEQRAAHPGTAAVPAASPETGAQDARAPRQPSPDSLPHSALRGHASAARTSAFSPDLITRQELQRELDSLRRLIESRK